MSDGRVHLTQIQDPRLGIWATKIGIKAKSLTPYHVVPKWEYNLLGPWHLVDTFPEPEQLLRAEVPNYDHRSKFVYNCLNHATCSFSFSLCILHILNTYLCCSSLVYWYHCQLLLQQPNAPLTTRHYGHNIVHPAVSYFTFTAKLFSSPA